MHALEGGYLGKALRIDLTKKKAVIRSIDAPFLLAYIGGRGFGARILWDETSHNTLPLSPENKLIIATGPLTGTFAPGSDKISLCSISPQTSLYADSNVGGMFGVELKQSGFDAAVIEGKAEKPSLILIENGKVEIQDSSHLWGLGSLETESQLRRDFGRDIQTLTIGPAGENLVKFACVTSDYGRQAGRTGMGAVLGSKKVKAIVVRGDGDLPIADLEMLEAIAKEAYNCMLSHMGFNLWRRQGTAQVIEWAQGMECLPTKNFQETIYENYVSIGGDALEKRKIADRACFACPIACRNVAETKQRKVKVEGPEYETLAMLGSNCALPSIDDAIYANYLCDELGLDTISTGAVVAFAMECYERGILSKDQIDGLDLRFGNAKAMFKLIEMIATRDGIGDVLAEGVAVASRKIGGGSEHFAMHVKGLEITGYDHRAAQAMALAYAVCDIGAHHNRAWAITYDTQVGRESYGIDKVHKVIYLQHVRSLFDCLCVCRFPWVELGLDLDFYERFYFAATGIRRSLNELLQCSERIFNLTRAINVRRGLRAKDDTLPKRDFLDPVPSGRTKGIVLDKSKFQRMIKTYYRFRGWDKDGTPTMEKLKQLGLNDVASALKEQSRKYMSSKVKSDPSQKTSEVFR